MPNTLIVRDATLAVNGTPDTRGGPKRHLLNRVAEVGAFDQQTAMECFEVLQASAVGEEADPEVLQALTILGAAQPALASQLGVSPISTGRRLAARLERLGNADHAIAVLEFLVERHPGHRSLERDMAGLMRRHGMVQDLIERYLERARRLLKDGNSVEAIEWLREVLLLDRGRKDVARTIRDLRYQEVDSERGKKKRWRLGLVVVLSIAGLIAGGIHEYIVRDRFYSIPVAEEGNLKSMKARLGTLETFVEEHPVWHGSLGVLRERTQLRIEVERLEVVENAEREKRIQSIQHLAEEADLSRSRGMELADKGDLRGALAQFQRALEFAAPDWEERERVERDVAAITEYLEKEQ